MIDPVGVKPLARRLFGLLNRPEACWLDTKCIVVQVICIYLSR